MAPVVRSITYAIPGLCLIAAESAIVITYTGTSASFTICGTIETVNHYWES